MRHPLHRIGVISDTHGLLRPEALAALAGSEYIVHAGDIGDARILDALAAIAPVTAVRGNNDHGSWASAVPVSATMHVGATAIHVLHDIAELAIDPVAQRIDVVVTGHSHHPRIERRDGVLFVNPGSAGPRRFRLPVTLARIVIDDGDVNAELIDLAPK